MKISKRPISIAKVQITSCGSVSAAQFPRGADGTQPRPEVRDAGDRRGNRGFDRHPRDELRDRQRKGAEDPDDEKDDHREGDLVVDGRLPDREREHRVRVEKPQVFALGDLGRDDEADHLDAAPVLLRAEKHPAESMMRIGRAEGHADQSSVPKPDVEAAETTLKAAWRKAVSGS